MSDTFVGNGCQKWFLNYVSEGVFEIVNSRTGYLVTDDSGLAVLSKSGEGGSRENQKWIFRSVEKDFDGYDLYYKIASYADTNLVLTFNANSNSLDVTTRRLSVRTRRGLCRIVSRRRTMNMETTS